MSVERHIEGEVALNDVPVAEQGGEDVAAPHTEGADDGSSSSDSDSASNHEDGEQNNNNNNTADDDNDLLLGIDLGGGGGDGEEGADATNEDNGDISIKKEKKSKDKKSKKDKDKKSKKDKHKDKKSKDKKSKKDKHKKDKHGSKRDRDLDGMEKYVRDAADNGVERRRRRKERASGANDDDGGHHHDDGEDRSYIKRGTSTVELKHLQSLLEGSLVPTTLDNGEMAYDVNAIHEVLVQLASLEVSYENLAATRIGTTVGKLLGAEYHSLMQAPFANAILRYWFLRLEEHRRKQLVRVDELENASVASQFDAREAPEEMAILNRIGVDIEKMFTLDELDAAGVVDASHIAGELSNLLTLDEDVRELVLNRLRAPDNKALRVKLLKGEVQATELVNHPDVVGVSETQRRRDFEQEEKYLHNRTL